LRGCERVGPGSADEVPEYLTRALERFKEEHHDGERFHEWEPRRPNEELWGGCGASSRLRAIRGNAWGSTRAARLTGDSRACVLEAALRMKVSVHLNRASLNPRYFQSWSVITGEEGTKA